MRIIQEGVLVVEPVPYWVGVEIHCPKCLAIWVLDENDQGPHGLKQDGFNSKVQPMVVCPSKWCKTRVVVPGTP